MEISFLSKSKVFFFGAIMSICFVPFGFAQNNGEFISAGEAKSIFENYYKSGIIEIEPLFKSAFEVEKKLKTIFLQNRKDRNISLQKELLTLYMDYAEIICTAYNFGAINKHWKNVKKIEKNIEDFLKAALPDSDFFISYSRYLYAKLPVHGNKLNIILSLPVLYRKAALSDKTNTAALVKLACWYIAAANENTSNFNAFIKENEEYIDYLETCDKFNAYIWYSVFYMKTYSTKKSFDYLKKANEVFPNHVLVRRLYGNYKKGIISI